MNNQNIQSEYKRPVISTLELEWVENYVVYSDSDSQTDYFNYARGSLRYMIKLLQKDAGDVVHVRIVNNETDPKYFKRIERIAKVLNYRIAVAKVEGNYADGNPYNYNEYYIYDPSVISLEQIKPQLGRIVGD